LLESYVFLNIRTLTHFKNTSLKMLKFWHSRLEF